MTTSVETFQTDLKEALLALLWQQWCRVGVAGSVKRTASFAIDPEVLLALTTEIGRYDTRVFDAMLEWLTVNGEWINIHRLSTITRRDGIGDERVGGAVAAWMHSRDRSAKWQRIAGRATHHRRVTPENLFLNMPRGAAAVYETPDRCFKSYGLLRQAIRVRGVVQSVNMNDPANLMFKCRALFGISMRADLICYLLLTDGGSARGISRVLGYNHACAQQTLSQLADAGFISMRTNGRAHHYWADGRGVLAPLALNSRAMPLWLNWRALARGLTVIWREAIALDVERADDYIASSKFRGAMRAARDDLLHSGIGLNLTDDKNHLAEAYLPVFMRDVRIVLTTLSTNRGDT